MFYQMAEQSIQVLDTTNNMAVSEFEKDEKKRFYLQWFQIRITKQ